MAFAWWVYNQAAQRTRDTMAEQHNANLPQRTVPLEYCVGASGGSSVFPWPNSEKKEEEMAGTYRIKVKDGDYGWNDGSYGVKDYILDTDNLAEALRDFLEWADNGDGTDKVTLTFRPAKGDK